MMTKAFCLCSQPALGAKCHAKCCIFAKFGAKNGARYPRVPQYLVKKSALDRRAAGDGQSSER